jgi:uncharacterized protein (TIGR02646 family)
VRRIQKGAPPPEIVPYRKDAQKAFDDFPHKDAVRAALVAEQGDLCCYCMRRIHANAGRMKIEHWASQNEHPERRFDWTNLLGACLGGEGRDARHQTCDTRKGGQAITVLPTDAHVARVRFSGEGKVSSSDQEIDRDLAITLNLNETVLVQARKKMLQFALEQLSKKHQGSWTKTVLLREREQWRPSQTVRKLKEFCEVVAQEFDRKLARIGPE